MTEQSQEAVHKATACLEKVIKLWKLKNSNNNTINPRKAIKRKVENSMMFLGRKISRKHLEPNSLEDITLTAQKVCEEYIEARLVRAGIKEYEYNSEVQTEEHLHVVKNMGQILEMKYPKLYTKISSHLKLSYENEIVVWDAFNKFGSHLFNDGITWARIIAFYAFTGGLAMDCMAQGKSELPARLVYWFGAFVMKKLAPWIQSQGGWVCRIYCVFCGKTIRLPSF